MIIFKELSVKLTKSMHSCTEICITTWVMLSVIVTDLLFNMRYLYGTPMHTTIIINKIDAIQKRATRFCLNDFSRYSSVSNILTTLDFPTLQQRRVRAKLVMMYKIIKISLKTFYPLWPSIKEWILSATNNKHWFILIFLFPSVIKLWNPLPSCLANSPSLDQFCNNLWSNHICAL